MSLVIVRLIRVRINECRYKTPRIRNHKLQRRSRRTLIMPGTIIGVPDQHTRNTSIHARGHHKSHPVLDLRVFDTLVCDDGVANNRRDENKEHDYTTEFEAVGDDCDDDCADGCNGVGDDGPELCFVGSIAELDNDGGEEETEGVEAGEDAEVGCCAEPGGDVEDSAPDFGPLEGFVVMFAGNVREK